MKKICLIIALLFVVPVIALFIFMLTFDVNQYKSVLIERMEESIHKDVRIGDISLDFLPGLGLKVDGVSIKDTNKTWDDVILDVASLEASIKLLPLIKKDIELEHLQIKGLKVNLTKDFLPIKAKGLDNQGQDVNVAVGALGSLKFLARSISIMDSSINYKDPASSLDIELDIIEMFLKNISVYGPVHISARLSLFARGVENINLKTVLYPEIKKKSPYLKNLNLRIELASVSLVDVLEALGQKEISRQLIGKKAIGNLVITSEKVHLSPKKIRDSNIYVALSRGIIDILPIRDELRNVELKAEMRKGDLVIEELTGEVAHGTFKGKGVIKDVFLLQYSNLEVALEDAKMSLLLPDSSIGDPSFEGTLDLDINCSAEGLMLEKLLDTMTAKGSIRIDRPVLRNINILETSLDKIDILPGLVEHLKSKMPLYYKELLRQRHTAFETIEAHFNIEDKKLFFEETEVSSKGFYVVGSGYLDMDRNIDIRPTLFIEKDLSSAFTNIVRELKYLQDTQGMITMPLEIKGKLPHVAVRPDLDYVVQKLAVSKGQELIGDFIKKSLPSRTSDESDVETNPRGDAEPWEEPAKAILNTIFDSILTPQSEGDGE